MEHAFASLNMRIDTAWATIAPETIQPAAGVPVRRWPWVVGKQGTLPPECLRIWWMGEGQPTGNAGELGTTVQLDFFTLGDPLDTTRRLKALDNALGFFRNAPYALLDVQDYTATPTRVIGKMRLIHPGGQWRDIPDPNPKLLHKARRFDVAWLY